MALLVDVTQYRGGQKVFQDLNRHFAGLHTSSTPSWLTTEPEWRLYKKRHEQIKWHSQCASEPFKLVNVSCSYSTCIVIEWTEEFSKRFITLDLYIIKTRVLETYLIERVKSDPLALESGARSVQHIVLNAESPSVLLLVSRGTYVRVNEVA